MSYQTDIANLVSKIDTETWSDKSINGIRYDIYPWHEYSAISLRTRGDGEDVAEWKYCECAKSEGEELKHEFGEYLRSYDAKLFHAMLIKAARALMNYDFSSYHKEKLKGDLGLSKLFEPMVFDSDETYKFNYCEFVVANDIEK